jgi:excisionase family DNA binding protein
VFNLPTFLAKLIPQTFDSGLTLVLIIMDKFTQISAMLRAITGALMLTNVEPAMTVRDVAMLLNVDEKTIYRLVTKGVLPGFKVLGSWRFQRSDLESWIEFQKQDAKQMYSADKSA